MLASFHGINTPAMAGFELPMTSLQAGLGKEEKSRLAGATRRLHLLTGGSCRRPRHGGGGTTDDARDAGAVQSTQFVGQACWGAGGSTKALRVKGGGQGEKRDVFHGDRVA